MSVGDFDRKTIIINSTYRESGTDSNFLWRFQERIENIRHAELRYFVLENGVYNVTDNNNTFWWYEGWNGSTWAHITQVTIPADQYDTNTFVSTLGLLLTAVSLGTVTNIYLCQLNSQGVLTISTSSTGTDFGIAFTDGLLNFPDTAKLMGFKYTTDEPSSSTLLSFLYKTIVADEPINIVGFDYVLIRSQKLGNDISFYGYGGGNAVTQFNSGNPVRGSATSCFCFIPNITPTANIGSLIYDNQRPPMITTLKYPYSLDYVDIVLVDKNGFEVDTRNYPVTLVIELYTDKISQNVFSHR
jgi:hypothetical protein